MLKFLPIMKRYTPEDKALNSQQNCGIKKSCKVPQLRSFFYICLVVSQNLGEGTLVQILCWYVRGKLGS